MTSQKNEKRNWYQKRLIGSRVISFYKKKKKKHRDSSIRPFIDSLLFDEILACRIERLTNTFIRNLHPKRSTERSSNSQETSEHAV